MRLLREEEEEPKKGLEEEEEELYSVSVSSRSGKMPSSSTLLMIWSLSNSFRWSSVTTASPACEVVDNNDRVEDDDDEGGWDEEVSRDDDNDCGFSSAVKITTHNANDAIATGGNHIE